MKNSTIARMAINFLHTIHIFTLVASSDVAMVCCFISLEQMNTNIKFCISPKLQSWSSSSRILLQFFLFRKLKLVFISKLKGKFLNFEAQKFAVLNFLAKSVEGYWDPVDSSMRTRVRCTAALPCSTCALLLRWTIFLNFRLCLASNLVY